MASEVQQLENFVKEALQAGLPRDAIQEALAAGGWPSDQIRTALGAFADIAFPIPVPRPRPSFTARDAFLYLLMFSALYIAAWHLASLLFNFVDQAFPELTTRAFGDFDDNRWSTASIIIATPVFLFLSYVISRQISRDPTKRLSPVRRWLTYMTLFIASITLIGDVTTLVYSLLGGDLTTRFVLKVLIVGAIAGCAFTYYLFDLRKEEKE